MVSILSIFGNSNAFDVPIEVKFIAQKKLLRLSGVSLFSCVHTKALHEVLPLQVQPAWEILRL